MLYLFPSLFSKIKMFPRILLGTDSIVIPLQFEHLKRSPFFGTVVKIPLGHSLGVSPSCHILPDNFFQPFGGCFDVGFHQFPRDVIYSWCFVVVVFFFTFFDADLISSSDINMKCVPLLAQMFSYGYGQFRRV